MKVFRDLLIHGSPDQIAALMDDVERSLTDGWRRNRPMEDSFRQCNAQERVSCFTCPEERRRPFATIFFTEKEPGLVHAANVTPSATHQLSYDEYNAILHEFHSRFVKPAAAKAGLEVNLTGTEAELEQWLSPNAAERLRDFSATANKATGASHPTDRERWNDFLLLAHQEKSTLDAPTLRRWLIEVENWPTEVAERLAYEYDFSREILDFAARRRTPDQPRNSATTHPSGRSGFEVQTPGVSAAHALRCAVRCAHGSASRLTRCSEPALIPRPEPL